MVFFETSLNTRLWYIHGSTEEVENLRYQLDGAVAKDRRSQKTVKYLQSEFDTVRATVDSY